MPLPVLWPVARAVPAAAESVTRLLAEWVKVLPMACHGQLLVPTLRYMHVNEFTRASTGSMGMAPGLLGVALPSAMAR